MDREHFITCIRAYFPEAQVSYSVRKVDGRYVNAQAIYLYNSSKVPFQISILNFYENGRTELYNHSRTVPIISEKKLLNYIRYLNNTGWYQG
jgi:hypothetical protein